MGEKTGSKENARRSLNAVALSSAFLAACATIPNHHNETALRVAQAREAYNLHDNPSVPVHWRTENDNMSIVIIREGSTLYQVSTMLEDEKHQLLAIRSCRPDQDEIGRIQTCTFTDSVEMIDENADGTVDSVAVGTSMGAGSVTTEFHHPEDPDWNGPDWQRRYNEQLDAVSRYIHSTGQTRV